MKTWASEQALGIAKRLRRFRLRIGARRQWYELGFVDGWEAANNIVEGTTKEQRDMSHRKNEKNAEIAGGKGAPGERSGNPDRRAHHEGPAGAGSISKSKFSKESRDSAGEKEPGKSRGPGVGEERVPRRLTREQLPP